MGDCGIYVAQQVEPCLCWAVFQIVGLELEGRPHRPGT